MKNITLQDNKSHNQTNNYLIILILGFLSALGPFSIDMYLPGFNAIALDFKTNISTVGYSLTAYFIGISGGQIIFGPLLDRYGRKKPLLFGLSLYFLATIGCFVAPNINVFIGMRLLSALGGCVGMVASSAIVRDLFPAKEIARIFSILLLVMGVAPIIAPTLGGFITSNFGWRYMFALLIIISTLMFLSVSFFLPESKVADPSISLKLKNILLEYIIVFKNRQFIIYALAVAANSAGLFAYISGSPFVYLKLFCFSEKNYGLIFGMNAMGLIIGSQINAFLLKRYERKKIIVIASIAQTITALVLLSTNILGVVPKTGVLILIFLYLFWYGFIGPISSSFALEPFKKNSGSASALLGSMQMISGALASGLVSYLQNGTIIPVVSVIATCAIIILVMVNIAKLTLRLEDI